MAVWRLAVAVLGVWRVTHLLHAEDGPWEVLARLRSRARGRLATDALGCFWCLSCWVALPFTLVVPAWGDRLLLWPALSAGAIAFELVVRRLDVTPAVYFHEEDPDALLRQDHAASPAG